MSFLGVVSQGISYNEYKCIKSLTAIIDKFNGKNVFYVFGYITVRRRHDVARRSHDSVAIKYVSLPRHRRRRRRGRLNHNYDLNRPR